MANNYFTSQISTFKKSIIKTNLIPKIISLTCCIVLASRHHIASEEFDRRSRKQRMLAIDGTKTGDEDSVSARIE